MSFAWDAGIVQFVINLIIILLGYGFVFLIEFKVVKRRSVYIATALSLGLTLASFLLNLIPALIVVASITAALLCVCLVANLGDLRAFLSSPFKRTTAKQSNFGVEKIFDRQTLYKTIETAVLQLSKTRTGAIITLEKSTSLAEIMKNGVPVHAPVSNELIQTIFYPGTRLHDGAIVIHNNEIVCAAVFYTPTTKPFAVKYGSRHRAALGISEVSDAVTIVVSEETGRISIAVDGQIDSVSPDNFLRVFENYMSDDSDD